MLQYIGPAYPKGTLIVATQPTKQGWHTLDSFDLQMPSTETPELCLLCSNPCPLQWSLLLPEILILVFQRVWRPGSLTASLLKPLWIVEVWFFFVPIPLLLLFYSFTFLDYCIIFFLFSIFLFGRWPESLGVG